mmetsp:Transcript_30036/g.46159  ORF Transcript_30036/g.46159 Transcript_30036/m.46159 type:complete len:85 (-) Transcript_30036:49-303(-)
MRRTNSGFDVISNFLLFVVQKQNVIDGEIILSLFEGSMDALILTQRLSSCLFSSFKVSPTLFFNRSTWEPTINNKAPGTREESV